MPSGYDPMGGDRFSQPMPDNGKPAGHGKQRLIIPPAVLALADEVVE
jgi:hypothetical protein